MGTSKSTQLGSSLVEQGLLSSEQLTEALAEQKRSGLLLGRVLIEKKFVTDKQIAQVIAAQLDVPYIDLRRFETHLDTANILTELQARRFRAIVLEDRGETYLIGLADPSDLRSQDELSMLLKRPIDVALVTNDQLMHTIDRIYRKTHQIGEFAREVERDIERDTNVIDLNKIGASIDDADAPVVKLLQTVIDDAAQVRASDIHIEPQENKLVVRFRIDGVLHTQIEADSRIASALLVRLKLMAGLDIAERRLPQDGRITVKSGIYKLDIRMSTMPTQHGESVVLRILMQNQGLRSLETSGMPAQVFQKFDRAIKSPHGIVLVTGPTGSGKTTTLYSALGRLNHPGVKIMTCEDPVEYRIPGISQVQVNEKIELTFARVLRSFLRQDPDILLVGEIRDEETAEIAVRAAMTGHMVLSTLHTNDAISTPSRLLDMGVAGYKVASTLLAVVSQRLLRVICQYCSEPYTPAIEELEWIKHYLSDDELAHARLRHGKGCTRCNGVGYTGRTGVFEIMEMTAPLAAAIHKGDLVLFEKTAREQMGNDTLERRALELVLKGETTIVEAMTVVTSIDA
ncbi:MAG: ATPase, T2SS/T4P/T4SS family [Gammaproteobacteria bacterium]